jgi:hypothetical protein
MKGVYQHCGEVICTAISRNSIFATTIAQPSASKIPNAPPRPMKGAEGKRLLYVQPSEAAQAQAESPEVHPLSQARSFTIYLILQP